MLATTKSEREAIDAFMDESNYKTTSPQPGKSAMKIEELRGSTSP